MKTSKAGNIIIKEWELINVLKKALREERNRSLTLNYLRNTESALHGAPANFIEHCAALDKILHTTPGDVRCPKCGIIVYHTPNNKRITFRLCDKCLSTVNDPWEPIDKTVRDLISNEE